MTLINLSCPNCKKILRVYRDDSDPDEAVRIESLCQDCAGISINETKFFDKNDVHINENYGYRVTVADLRCKAKTAFEVN